ncbi:O-FUCOSYLTRANSFERASE 2-RELATED [Salix koriyanagi]|uniref:O-fucosyltransferase family protein n=1 Tax=Salix koriyanagi TaxID=2511006 RepID=A0A9Q1AH90_9ROSI|nr:O-FUCOSYLTRANSFERASE 2-RELATED [Salix koriyanagi]
MAELRHSSSLGARASSSPMKRDEDASPLIHGTTHDDDDRHHLSRDRDRSFWSFLSDDPRNAPYLCKKDGIVLHCPHVNEAPSLWENPYSATTSWKPCAERRDNGISDLPPENETNGYIFIHAEGGLNQQRIAICNAVAVAKIMNATLILPVLKQDQIWKDQTKFEDIFDVDHFIDYLKYDVRIVRDIPEWFTDKSELFTSIRRTVKNYSKVRTCSILR